MLSADAKSIKQQFSFALFWLSVVLIFQAAAFVFVQYEEHKLELQQQLMTSVTTHQMFGDMKHDGIQGDVFRFIDATGRGDRAKIAEAVSATNQDIVELNKTYDFVFAQTYSEPLQSISRKTVLDRDNYAITAHNVIERIEHNPNDYHGALDAFTASFDRFEHSQETLIEAIKAEREAEAKLAETLYLASLAITVLGIVCVGGTLAWVTRFVIRRIVSPIETVTATLQRMAHGDYSQAISGDDKGDEVERMSAAAAIFRATALSMQQAELDQKHVVAELAAGLERLAESDLEYRIDTVLPGQYEQLRNNFNKAARSLAQAMGSVRVGSSSPSVVARGRA